MGITSGSVVLQLTPQQKVKVIGQVAMAMEENANRITFTQLLAVGDDRMRKRDIFS